MYQVLRAIRLTAAVVSVCWAVVAFGQTPQKNAPQDPAGRAFTEKVAAALAAQMPNEKFEVVEDFRIRRDRPGGVKAFISTHIFYPDYRQDPASLDRIVELIAGAMTDKAPTGARVLRQIVPVIKDRGWLKDVRQSLKEGVDLLYEDYNDELVVVYAIDTKHRTRYLMSNEDVGDRKSLRARAVDNLSRLLPDVEVNGGGGVWMVRAGGDYEASLLLFEKMWRSDKIKVDGDIVVAVPANNTLIITGSNNQAAVAKLRKLAAELVTEARYSITSALFIYRDGRFVTYDK
jgi:uncharacterized protein YtpQ (UPF0354 family)